jgi:hypothetical protein
MNAKHEPSAGKKALVDSLLAIDSSVPASSAEGREVAKAVLRRDRRRVRILTWATIGLFLLTVVGIGGSAYFYHIKVTPSFEKLKKDIILLEQQLDKQQLKSTKPDLVDWTARIAAAGTCTLFLIQFANLYGTLALFAVMLAAAVSTVLLIRASRTATLHQIQASLLALSEQFDSLQQSLQASHSSGGGQATKESSG